MADFWIHSFIRKLSLRVDVSWEKWRIKRTTDSENDRSTEKKKSFGDELNFQ